MEPLVALIVGFLSARLAGLIGVEALDGWHPALRVGLALLFVLTGISHFHPRLRPDIVGMVPPRLPRPDLLVTVTGALELLGAIGLLIPGLVSWAAVGLALLMVGMFPANVSAARRQVAQGDPLGWRTVLQLVYIAAAVLVAL
ncbi:DoxX family protein [Streptomyces zagrosensis]|uniref:Putative membrane protein n=1 Tax=Streptomyces zagrosensis TaxID=1042984 RepID=A0A7W9QBL2_9ACTN|nr:DoxX family membrane protein [Streptomyces zagrosensis]MBB5937175.1 putative membrane protein [Streptomyces zagrosensis]